MPLKLLISATYLSCVLFLSGCQFLDIFTPEINYIDDPVSGYRITNDILYGRDKNVTFDLYQPISIGGNPAEVVILLHGGGWTSGDKIFLSPTISQLMDAKKNLAIVNINYRVLPASSTMDLFSTQMADMQSIIEFLRYNAEKYNIRTDNYRLAGSSAGGHIAMAYAYKTNESSVKAIIAASAPTELSIKELLNKSLWPNVEKLTGMKYSETNINVFKEASPFYMANYRCPRTILIYGQQDTLVSPQQGDMLAKKLRLMKIPFQFQVYPEETHDITPRRFAESILQTYN